MFVERVETLESKVADGSAAARPSTRNRLQRWRKTFVGELVEIAVIAILLFLVARVAVQNFRVNGFSMLPSLHNNEFILVDKLSYDFGSPHRGDIVVFKYPFDTSRDFIKRIIGVPGDRVSVHGGGVYINGRRLHEKYIKATPKYTMSLIPFANSSIVPPNDYFVLGDNRRNSDDSHMWGLLPRKDIIGRALIAYWPPQDFGMLSDPSVGMAKVGGGVK